MANMSYCRFENTTKDMEDCINAIEEGDTKDLSRYEASALREFLHLAFFTKMGRREPLQCICFLKVQ